MTDWDSFSTETGGGKGISFGGLGDRSQINVPKGGIVVAIRPKKQQMDMESKTPLFEKDNITPKWQLPVVVQTDERDPMNPADTGERVLYVKGFMTDAIRKALTEAGAETLEIGGKILVAYIGEHPQYTRSRNYVAQYTKAPPQAAAQGQFFAQQQAAPAQAPVAQQPPPPPNWGQAAAAPQQPAAAPAAPAWTPPPAPPAQPAYAPPAAPAQPQYAPAAPAAPLPWEQQPAAPAQAPAAPGNPFGPR